MTNKQRRNRRLQKKVKLIVLISSIVLLAALAIFLTIYFMRKSAVNAVAKEIIWDNVYIEDMDMSGIQEDAARQMLESRLEEYQQEKVTLVSEGKEVELTLGDLGLQAENLEDVVEKAVSYGKTGSVWARYRKLQKLEEEPLKYDVIYQIDLDIAQTVITEQVPNFENEAIDATIKREKNQFVITDSATGKTIDVEASLKNVKEQFTDWEYQGPEIIELVTVIDEPKVSREQLEQIQDVLGKFTTHFAAGSNKAKNVANAASFINGTVLMPGEEMSASDTMKPRTKANGYVEAGAYLDGEVVDSLGGGVCQVSTTLYNAILLAELEVVQRYPHSMLVSYVDPSMDAAIAEGYKDLKFKNNMDTPIYIEGYVSGGSITFVVYGKETRSANRVVSYVSEVVSEKEAPKTFVATGDAVGTLKKTVNGSSSMKAKLWKVVKENGVEVSKEAINSSSYSAKKSTWSVGTGTDNAQAKKLITDAIATQNETKIKDAIARAQALIKEAQQTVAPVTPENSETETDNQETDATE